VVDYREKLSPKSYNRPKINAEQSIPTSANRSYNIIAVDTTLARET
jgi:hypothetical protein